MAQPLSRSSRSRDTCLRPCSTTCACSAGTIRRTRRSIPSTSWWPPSPSTVSQSRRQSSTSRSSTGSTGSTSAPFPRRSGRSSSGRTLPRPGWRRTLTRPSLRPPPRWWLKRSSWSTTRRRWCGTYSPIRSARPSARPPPPSSAVTCAPSVPRWWRRTRRASCQTEPAPTLRRSGRRRSSAWARRSASRGRASSCRSGSPSPAGWRDRRLPTRSRCSRWRPTAPCARLCRLDRGWSSSRRRSRRCRPPSRREQRPCRWSPSHRRCPPSLTLTAPTSRARGGLHLHTEPHVQRAYAYVS
mmetsp:Transcript_33223/g.107443  ORF Transcript_33223/g.107443 Transcript_33223/m.107443 type:complete len:298 (+) Transcript_33223:348-1241(+)